MQLFDHASRATKGARDYQEDTAAVRESARARVTSGGSDPETTSPSRRPQDAGEVTVADGKPASQMPPSHMIAVLADGMGGHAGGALASEMVCKTFIGAFGEHDGSVPRRLMAALGDANSALANKVRSDPLLSGMGSTMIGVSLGVDGAHWVSVGDSPLLLYRHGEVAVLNEDHSLAPELDRLAAAGKISREAARNDPRRHMLRSAVTGEELDLVDRSRKPLALEVDDYIILASDGVQTLDNSEIERIVAAYADDGARAVAGALIRSVEAVRDPHQDNATVIVVRVLAQSTP